MKRLPKEERAGLYITIIVHLVVIIILLIAQLGTAIKKENSYVMDFSKFEELEKLQKEIAFKEEISRRLEEMIGEAGGAPIRNVTVDRGSLKDDRGTDAEKLYRDAARLSKQLGASPAEEEVMMDEPKEKQADKEEEKKTTYKGPSVLSWELTGRKASKLPIPAYRCIGAGEVKVIIGVNNQGAVISANIDDSVSSPDGCLRNFAIRAARMSKFSMSASAPSRQEGYIIYQFIAQ